MTHVIRTLIVDDSAFVRKTVREILSRSAYVEVVGTARDGVEALERVEELKPDVVTCDLTMPRCDGVEFVRRQMLIRPLPILILTSSTEDAPAVVEALAAGAVDFVKKPTTLATPQLQGIRQDLLDKVKLAADCGFERTTPPAPVASSETTAPQPPVAPTPVARKDSADILVIGISTGGPQALRRILPLFGADFPVPIAIVLHMPVGYTAAFAERLDGLCPLEMVEARAGDEVRQGRILLAPAGRHLELMRVADGRVRAHLSLQPHETSHRPSVDVLFKSAASVYGPNVLAVVMTGMGDDGKLGAAFVKSAGGRVVTESEGSCIVYGMPRSVVEAGLSDKSLPLQDLAPWIIHNL